MIAARYRKTQAFPPVDAYVQLRSANTQFCQYVKFFRWSAPLRRAGADRRLDDRRNRHRHRGSRPHRGIHRALWDGVPGACLHSGRDPLLRVESQQGRALCRTLRRQRSRHEGHRHRLEPGRHLAGCRGDRERPAGGRRWHFMDKAAEFFARLGAARAHLSITHTEELAMAQVILESEAR